jgi:hypothetical protein
MAPRAPKATALAANRSFDGVPIEQYAGLHTLIFGSPDSLAEARRLVKLARDYVTAAAKDERERAVYDSPAQEAPPPPVASEPAIHNPNDPAPPRVVVPGLPRPR